MVQKGGIRVPYFNTQADKNKAESNKRYKELEADAGAEVRVSMGINPDDEAYPIALSNKICEMQHPGNLDNQASCQRAANARNKLKGGKSKSRKNKKRVGKKGAKKTTRARKTSKARKTSRSRKYKK